MHKQAADYLRTSASKALAKRNFKTQIQQQARGELDSLQEQAVAVCKSFQNIDAADTEINPDERSLCSMYNNQEAYEALIEQNICFQDFSDLELLRIVGLLGVCLSCKSIRSDRPIHVSDWKIIGRRIPVNK